MDSLIHLRWLGGILGTLLFLWAFFRFRGLRIRRFEFFIYNIIGIAIVVVSIEPSSMTFVAELLSLEGKHFGRLITLLILSNFMLWFVLFYERGKQLKRDTQFDRMVRNLSRHNFEMESQDVSLGDIVVVMPAFNEAENISDVLMRMPCEIDGYKVTVLVVDDGSVDNTAGVVRDAGHRVVSSIINRGGGAALRLGYDIAMEHGAHIIVTMDADGQHLPEELPNLVRPILGDASEFVIGSRLMGIREKDSVVRLVGIYVFNRLINLLAGTRITDCSSGYRAFRVEALRRVMLRQDQFHTAELLIDAARKGVLITEAPITVRRRTSGVSKKGGNFTYGLNFLKTIMKTWLG